MFNAWSINPLVLEKYGAIIDGVAFVEKEENVIYYMPIATIRECGIIKTFSGGETIYLPEKLCTKLTKSL